MAAAQTHQVKEIQSPRASLLNRTIWSGEGEATGVAMGSAKMARESKWVV
jgi:hypothetical protein